MLQGDNPRIFVEELTKGSADIYPGDFTYEVQTVAIDALSIISGEFKLTFEGKQTGWIPSDAR